MKIYINKCMKTYIDKCIKKLKFHSMLYRLTSKSNIRFIRRIAEWSDKRVENIYSEALQKITQSLKI